VFLDFDSLHNPLLGAGQARATYEVGTRFIKAGHTVTVITSKYPGYKNKTYHGITYKHIGINTKNIRLNNALYILFLPFTVMRLKADIVIECFTAPISTLFTPLFTKIPVVVITSSFDAERFTKLYHLPFDKIERFGLRFYSYALPYTKYFEDKMRAVKPDLIAKPVPEGVDEEFFKIKRKQAEYILFLGRYDMDQKGIDLLLTAYARVKRAIRYPLVIAGAGPDEKKIIKLVKKLNLEDRVTMIGPTYGKKKTRVLEKALFVALPSRQETFSVFALEALAAGRSLVTFDIPGLAWMEEGITYKAQPFNTDEYGKLLLAMSRKTKAAVLGKRAREFAKQFSWERTAEEYLAFFTEVLYREASKKVAKNTQTVRRIYTENGK